MSATLDDVTSKDEAVAFLDVVVPRMRTLGVTEFSYAGAMVTLGMEPGDASEKPAPKHRLSAVELAIAGPPIEPQYVNAKPSGK